MKFVFLTITLFLFIGCTNSNKTVEPSQAIQNNVIQKASIKVPVNENSVNENIIDNLNAAIIDTADQLFFTKTTVKPIKIILTSFVDLDMFDKTSSLGRILSESMYNELHIRKFNVTDFRGQDSVSVNEDGEFHISRDTEKLKDTLEAINYILVGTYAKFENESLIINARILDSVSGEVISSSRVIYQPKECSIFDVCDIIKSNRSIIGENTNSTMSTNNANTFSIIHDNGANK